MQERVVKIPFETAAHEKAFVPRGKDRNAVNSQIPKPFILLTIRIKTRKIIITCSDSTSLVRFCLFSGDRSSSSSS